MVWSTISGWALGSFMWLINSCPISSPEVSRSSIWFCKSTSLASNLAISLSCFDSRLSKASWVAVDMGLFKSEVLSTFPRPTSALFNQISLSKAYPFTFLVIGTYFSNSLYTWSPVTNPCESWTTEPLKYSLIWLGVNISGSGSLPWTINISSPVSGIPILGKLSGNIT